MREYFSERRDEDSLKNLTKITGQKKKKPKHGIQTAFRIEVGCVFIVKHKIDRYIEKYKTSHII